MTRILYLRPRNITNPLHPAVCSPLLGEVAKIAQLDDILHDPSMTEDELADLIRQYDAILTMWQTPRLPDSLATNPGRLRYICNVTGEMKTFVSQALIDSPYLTVTNWGDSTAPRVAEGAMTLLLSMLKSLNGHYDSQKAGGQGKPDGLYPGSLWRLPVGIYGMGPLAGRLYR